MFKLKVVMLILLAGFGARAAEQQQSEFSIGRAYYSAGDFKKAAAHLRLAVKAHPSDAESYYWMGLSFQKLADIAAPFDGRYKSRARACLTKAVELAPDRTDYRNELFDFLLDSAGSSRGALARAAGILAAVPASDADYIYMRRRFNHEKEADSSLEFRIGNLLLAGPRAAFRIGSW